MGGKGSGGRRIGAGRKPKTARERWLTGDASRTGLALVEAPADVGAPKGRRRRQRARKTPPPPPPVIGAAGPVPAELGPAERVFWERWAPRAKALGTLTDDTLPAFVVLCETAADAQQCRDEIYGRGIVSVLTSMRETGNDDQAMEVVTVQLRAHPLWPSYRGLKARLEQLLARYGLAAMGKTPESSEQDDEDDEFRKLMATS